MPLLACGLVPKCRQRCLVALQLQKAQYVIRIPEFRPVPAVASILEHTTAVETVYRHIQMAQGRVIVITGAGISTDSGIPDYRGDQGTYKKNPKHRPILYNEIMSPDHAFRKRYWARSFFGWRQMAQAKPNAIHNTLAWMLQHGHIEHIITQNVDDLHRRAGTPLDHMVELHGTLRWVECMDCHTLLDRQSYQHRLYARNPAWAEYQNGLLVNHEEPRINPDGDVDLPGGLDYNDFDIPPCLSCGKRSMKPRVVFFGENTDTEVGERARQWVEKAQAILVLGSTLTTYSAFRLARLAHDMGKPIGIINRGPTRADNIATWKVDLLCGPVLQALHAQMDAPPANMHVGATASTASTTS